VKADFETIGSQFSSSISVNISGRAICSAMLRDYSIFRRGSKWTLFIVK